MRINLKNFTLIVSVLAIAYVVGIYIPYLRYQKTQQVRHQEPLPTTENRSATTTKIMYTNAGFDPKTITIAVGTSVEWQNKSNKLMWVASDPHPSHNNLPGFDERGIDGGHSSVPSFFLPAYAHAEGGVYIYTFNKVGTWTYHNHVIPSDRGTVIVR